METLLMASGIHFDRSARRLGVLLCLSGLLLSGGPIAAGAAAPDGGSRASAENAPPSAAPDTRPYTVLVTNADHGLGYEFMRQYAERGWIVIAAVRKPRAADQLNAIAGYWDNVHVEKLDVTSGRSVRALAARYRGEPIDVLINNVDLPGNADGQKSGQYDFNEFDDIIDANVEGPLRMIEAFMDNVAASRKKKIMTLSSAAGSIRLTTGGRLFYRSSKAALNMAIRTLSREMQQDPDPRRQALVFGLIDPGAVAGGTASPAATPALAPRAAAEYSIAVIEGFTPANSGEFLDRKGEAVPW